jgi:hypothetical protein
VVVTTLERQLGYEQGRNDFRLGDDDIISINRPTTACVNAVNYIATQTKSIQVRTCLEGLARVWSLTGQLARDTTGQSRRQER